MRSAINPHRCQHEPVCDLQIPKELLASLLATHVYESHIRLHFLKIAQADWRCAKCGKRLKRPVWRVRGSM